MSGKAILLQGRIIKRINNNRSKETEYTIAYQNAVYHVVRYWYSNIVEII